MMPGRGFGVPSASDVNNVADQIGGTAGTILRTGNMFVGDQVRSSISKYVPGVELLFKSLKHYFNVDNDYVKLKAKVILLPFWHKNWQRRQIQGTGPGGSARGSNVGLGFCPSAFFSLRLTSCCPHRVLSSLPLSSPSQADAYVFAPPAEDVNAPDLYIPTMMGVTFVVLVSFLTGNAGSFTPEVCVFSFLAFFSRPFFLGFSRSSLAPLPPLL